MDAYGKPVLNFFCFFFVMMFGSFWPLYFYVVGCILVKLKLIESYYFNNEVIL
jgi:hypothetical protein